MYFEDDCAGNARNPAQGLVTPALGQHRWHRWQLPVRLQGDRYNPLYARALLWQQLPTRFIIKRGVIHRISIGPLAVCSIYVQRSPFHSGLNVNVEEG